MRPAPSTTWRLVTTPAELDAAFGDLRPLLAYYNGGGGAEGEFESEEYSGWDGAPDRAGPMDAPGLTQAVLERVPTVAVGLASSPWEAYSLDAEQVRAEAEAVLEGLAAGFERLASLRRDGDRPGEGAHL
jgi:hypothetical protein